MRIETYSNIWRSAMCQHPEFRIFYPRRIAYPHGHYDPEHYALIMMGNSLQWGERFAVNSQVTNCLGVVCSQLVRYQFPIYYVDEQLLEAVDLTRPPDLTLDEIHWPMPAIIFSLPVEWVRRRMGWPMAFIGCARAEKGDIKIHPTFARVAGMPDDTIAMQNSMALFHFPYLSPDGTPCDYTSRYPLTFKVSELVTDMSHYEDTTKTERWVYDAEYLERIRKRDEAGLTPSKEDEVKLLNELTSLAGKLLLIMSARPELVTRGVQSRKEKVHKGVVVREALWHPNFIGLGYKIKRSESTGEGTHASPRMHWRVGHWHTVVHGKGRTLRKTSWFEPVLVNAPERTI